MHGFVSAVLESRRESKRRRPPVRLVKCSEASTDVCDQMSVETRFAVEVGWCALVRC